MNKILRNAGSLLVFGACFVGAKTLVQAVVHDSAGAPGFSEEKREVLLAEAEQSGVREETALQIADSVETMLNSKDTRQKVSEAYGSVSGSDAEIARRLDADPPRRRQVGYAMEALIMEEIDFPMRLDEITLYTGIHYQEENATFVYHYDVEEDWSGVPATELEGVRSEVEKMNPNAVCETSLSVLAQGFDMAYRYRDSTGAELFRITKTHSDCQLLGY